MSAVYEVINNVRLYPFDTPCVTRELALRHAEELDAANAEIERLRAELAEMHGKKATIETSLINARTEIGNWQRTTDRVNAELATARNATSNLATMVRRGAWLANKQTGDTSMKVWAGNAKDLLRTLGMEGNPLREEIGALKREGGGK